MSTAQPKANTIVSSLGSQAGYQKQAATILSTNPAAVDEVVAEIGLADSDTFAEACRLARANQPAWAAVPAPTRGQAIANVCHLVTENKHALAELITREIGKTTTEALGEVQEVIDTCALFLGEGRRLYGMTVPSEMPNKELFAFRQPVGVAAIITPGNFPAAVPSWYLVPALLCGNAVVWKPAEYAAATAQALARLFWHAGISSDVLSVIHADGQTTYSGLELALERGLVDKVGFTGSTGVGRRIGELCGRHLQRPCLELGGKNPLVIMDDADMDLAVAGTVFSAFATAGQRCTSLGTVIVDDKIHDRFLSRFAHATQQASIGDPTREVLYGPMLEERFLRRFEGEWLELIGHHHGVQGSQGVGRITSANPRDGFVGEAPERGMFVHPTIVSGVGSDDALANTETFGPIVGVARFSDWEQAIALANGHGYGLSAAIYTRDPKHAFRFRADVSAGMVSINNSTAGAEAHLPFGGNGRSGNGSRQAGVWVLEEFSRWQSVNWDYGGQFQRAQMDVADIQADLDFRL
jgi:aldehyde dehydrogenase (NAD+)